MEKKHFVDMHCHPSIKPYSWYISDRNNPLNCRNIKTSIWYNDPPGDIDKKINEKVGLTKFKQSDFRTLTKGDVKIASACLSPVERGLFTPRGRRKKFGFRLLKFGLELNPEFITKVKGENRDYFEELEDEYKYFLSEQTKQHTRTFPSHFRLTSDFDEIESPLENVDADIIYIFFSMEGCHVFNNAGLESQLHEGNEEDEAEVSRRIQKVKGWEYRPLYASMAHHINNNLCGHARSLPPFLGKLVDQTEGLGDAFSGLGRAVLHELLDNTNKDRIYIDIKHMSEQSREEYFNILASDYSDDPIPILVSHGAVKGPETIEERNPGGANNGEDGDRNNEDRDRYQNEDELKFNNDEINFSDDEIIRIEKSKGFFGIMLDERRLIAPEQLKIERKKERTRGERLFYQAGLVWKQIRYIAEVIDKKEKFGWGTATIGSDYDGAVDPPNGYWTADDFGILEENLIHHATEYFRNHSNDLTNQNQLNNFNTPEEKAVEVIKLVMRGNAERFLRNYLC